MITTLFEETIRAIDAGMHITTFNKTIFALCVAIALVGCSRQDPYIFKAAEFDRNNPNFARDIEDRSTVMICYNKRHTSPKILLQMAKDECGRFGKRALFSANKTLECSVSAPAQAVFWCLAPGETVEELRNKTKEE